MQLLKPMPLSSQLWRWRLPLCQHLFLFIRQVQLWKALGRWLRRCLVLARSKANLLRRRFQLLLPLRLFLRCLQLQLQLDP